MTLKECVSAAAEKAGITLVESFSDYSFGAVPSDAAVFISQCESQLFGDESEEWIGIDRKIHRTEKQHIKLTAFSALGSGMSRRDSALCALRDIFSNLALDESFFSPQFSISKAKTSAPHSGVLREANISAITLHSDIAKEDPL